MLWLKTCFVYVLLVSDLCACTLILNIWNPTENTWPTFISLLKIFIHIPCHIWLWLLHQTPLIILVMHYICSNFMIPRWTIEQILYLISSWHHGRGNIYLWSSFTCYSQSTIPFLYTLYLKQPMILRYVIKRIVYLILSLGLRRTNLGLGTSFMLLWDIGDILIIC